MGLYKDAVNYSPHNFNTSVLTLNGEHVVQGLDKVMCEPKEDTWTTQEVASGASILVANPSRAGSFKFSFLEASATTDYIVGKMQAGENISFAFTDSNAPNLNCSAAQSRVRKHPAINRSGEVDVPEWELVCTYLNCVGGSYALESVA